MRRILYQVSPEEVSRSYHIVVIFRPSGPGERDISLSG